MRRAEIKLRIAILTCTQSAQRISYYNALGLLCDLTVIAERETPAEIICNYNVKPATYRVIYLKGIPMFGYMAFCPSVMPILKKYDEYDVIIIEQYATPTSIIAINFMSRHGIPFVLSVDSGFADISEKGYKYRFKKSLISKASLWMTGGENSKEYLRHYGAEPDKIKIFKFSPYSTRDLPNHQISAKEKLCIRERLKIKERLIIMSVGQQIHRKGFDILLKAFNRIDQETDDVGLYILGGEPNDECRELLSTIPSENVHFPGFVTKDELKLYYSTADIFVFPTRYDIWGYPVNEAMSFGLPVITTKQCNAGLELVQEGINGYLVEKEDVDGLYRAIMSLIDDKEKRRTMGSNNYLKSKDYTSETMAESVYEILKEFCADKGRVAE